MHLVLMPYAERMDWSLRELRFFVAAVESGSFTDAAISLRVSQASVSLSNSSTRFSGNTAATRKCPRL